MGRRAEHPGPSDERLEAVSAALDGAGPMPDDLTPAEREFLDGALRLRAAVRVGAADTPPDVTERVLAEIADPPARRVLVRPTFAAAAAVFLVAALVAALAVRPGGPLAPSTASAGIDERVLDGQRLVTAFTAVVTVEERGVHPDVPVRRLTGSLAYQAPESLHLSLREEGTAGAGWPANDLDLTLADGAVRARGLADCPVGEQPGCLRFVERAVDGLAPFAPDWLAAFDLVVPTDAFIPATDTASTPAGDRVVVTSTAARADRVLAGLRAAGAIRAVHPTDAVRFELDAADLTLRRLTVTATDDPARANWAASTGYRDEPGATVLDVTLEPAAPAPVPIPGPATAATDAGFTDTDDPPPWPDPPGFALHRSGVLAAGGPPTTVAAYTAGRAWIRIDVTDAWDEQRLFGGLGPTVRPIAVGDGVGYTDAAGTTLALHTPERDVVVTGSVDLATLIHAAAPLITGQPIPGDWPQAVAVDGVPAGALVPPGEHLAAMEGSRLIIAIGGPGASSVTLVQEPALRLGPADRGDVLGVTVRGVPGRYEPRSGALVWLEDGWRRELRAPGADLAALRVLAASLVDP